MSTFQRGTVSLPRIKNSPSSGSGVWKHFTAYNRKHSLVSQRGWYGLAGRQIRREGRSGEREFHTSARPSRTRIYTVLVQPTEREHLSPCLFKIEKKCFPKGVPTALPIPKCLCLKPSLARHQALSDRLSSVILIFWFSRLGDRGCDWHLVGGDQDAALHPPTCT